MKELSKIREAMYFPHYLVLLALSLYLVLAFIKICQPGIQYDEILFGNAARGVIDKSFVWYRIGNFPVLLMPYIGGLKAYLYYLIFKIFGVSAYTIRLPMIFLSALAI
jgi:hypothetical protein